MIFTATSSLNFYHTKDICSVTNSQVIASYIEKRANCNFVVYWFYLDHYTNVTLSIALNYAYMRKNTVKRPAITFINNPIKNW